MKKQNVFIKSKFGKNKLANVIVLSVLILLVVISLTKINFIQKGQASQTTQQNTTDAVSPQVIPTPPPTLISNRCSAYTAPPVPAPLPGRTFYVDAQNGNDGTPQNPRTGSSSEPWKTLDKANTEAQPGTLFLI